MDALQRQTSGISSDTLKRMSIACRGKIISRPEDLSGGRVLTRGVDWDVSGQWWATTYTGDPFACESLSQREHVGQLLELRRILLGFGGSQVCLPFVEDDLQSIQQRGQLWSGFRVVLKRGEPRRCHSNSAMFLDANRRGPAKVLLATGYGLSNDGMWRQHR